MQSNELSVLTKSLITEAQRSPTLLTDLAGLESYVAESYSGRSFIELLQNADDAGAKKFAVQSVDGLLAVANDGRPFTFGDLESLCRSAASTKTRGQSIGYRGIGFKSVVGIAESVYLFSGDFEIQFSRRLTKMALETNAEVPLIRIPHALESGEVERVRAVAHSLIEAGFNTVFVFDPTTSASIESEFAELNSSTLLFLNSVQHLTFFTPSTSYNRSLDRRAAPNGVTRVEIICDDTSEQWLLSGTERVTLAAPADLDLETEGRANQDKFVVHAFLPTHERTGFRFKVNGDFSTDPSRTRVVVDGQSSELVSEAASQYLRTLNSALQCEMDQDRMGSLIPFEDLRNSKFSRPGFYTRLVEQIQRQAGTQFEDLVLRPPWMNGDDYYRLVGEMAGVRTMLPYFEQVVGLRELLLFLGARDAELSTLLRATEKCQVEELGAVEVVAAVVRDQATRGSVPGQSLSKSKVWKSGDKIVSLDELQMSGNSLDEDFVENLTEKGASASSVRRLVAGLSDDAIASRLIPENKKPATQQTRATKSVQRAHVNATRWRSAEQQVAEVMRQQGWTVDDVSRQNLGYDLKATHPEIGLRLVEVKSVSQIGSEFSLTTNEEGVARKEGENYYIAVVSSTQEGLEIGMIQHPTQSVSMERQCRQWAWVCDSYECPVEFVPYG